MYIKYSPLTCTNLPRTSSYCSSSYVTVSVTVPPPITPIPTSLLVAKLTVSVPQDRKDHPCIILHQLPKHIVLQRSPRHIVHRSKPTVHIHLLLTRNTYLQCSPFHTWHTTLLPLHQYTAPPTHLL